MNSRVSMLERVLNNNTFNARLNMLRDNDAVLRASEPVGFEYFRFSNINSLVRKLQAENPGSRGEDMLELASSVFYEIGTRSFLGDVAERDIPMAVQTLNNFASNKAKMAHRAQRTLHSLHNASTVSNQTLQSVPRNAQPTPWMGGKQFSREHPVSFTPRRTR